MNCSRCLAKRGSVFLKNTFLLFGNAPWEVHFIVGYGEMVVTCCDDEGKKWKHRYKKVCGGAAVDISIAVGKVSNSNGQACSNPPKKLLGGEFGFGGDLLGIEGSATVDIDGGGVAYAGGGGGGGGVAKATACYYWLYISEYTGTDCCQ